jgi:4-diphosphocytidyl-2-C-methyl-D-erythritol kinase
MISFPNAKINLGLDIIGKRSDGFHNLSSCFYPIPLFDVLEIVESGKLNFQTSGLPITGDPKHNLVLKAYQLLKKDFNLPYINIHLHKVIPMESGFGGGSSDGAFMLKTLNELFELFLEDVILEDYAGILGSDCPFFINNQPAMVTGRGEQLEPVDLELNGYHIILIKPDFTISTQEAYKMIHPQIPEFSINDCLSQSIKEWRNNIKNDFEIAFTDRYPDLTRIKNVLYDNGALYAAMTGSGSAMYGLFSKEIHLKELFPKEYFYWSGNL